MPRKQIVPPTVTSVMLTTVNSIFDIFLVHWCQLRKSQKRPDTPYENQLANKLDIRARRSLNSGMLRFFRRESWAIVDCIPLCDDPSNNPEAYSDACPQTPSLPCILRMILWKCSYVDVSRRNMAIDDTRNDNLPTKLGDSQ